MGAQVAAPESPATGGSRGGAEPVDIRLVQTWHANFSPEIAAEAAGTLTWELAEQYGSTRLTVTHETTDAPLTRP